MGELIKDLDDYFSICSLWGFFAFLLLLNNHVKFLISKFESQEQVQAGILTFDIAAFTKECIAFYGIGFW